MIKNWKVKTKLRSNVVMHRKSGMNQNAVASTFFGTSLVANMI